MMTGMARTWDVRPSAFPVSGVDLSRARARRRGHLMTYVTHSATIRLLDQSYPDFREARRLKRRRLTISAAESAEARRAAPCRAAGLGISISRRHAECRRCPSFRRFAT